jgi:thiol-disulfide isomerase/thioredoxin
LAALGPREPQHAGGGSQISLAPLEPERMKADDNRRVGRAGSARCGSVARAVLARPTLKKLQSKKETPMRALCTLLSLALAVAIAAPTAQAQSKLPSAAELLGYHPTQKSVEYDIPDRSAIDTCKVELVQNAKKETIGYALRDAQGKLLRRFVNARGEPNLDQWSYYQDGFEVYRDIDLDNDRQVDECRWLNSGGTRHAVVSKNRIIAWKRLSAEEASKVLVQALTTNDLALLETVMASADELAGLGIPKGETERVAAAAARRAEQLKALQKDLTGWSKETTWLRFDGMMPHLISADAHADLKADLVLYENAVIFVSQGNNQSNPANFAYLQAAEMIKLGETWKFVELPRAVDPQKPVAMTASDSGIRMWIFREPEAGAAPNPQLAAALQALATFDGQNANVVALGDKRKAAEYYRDRIKLLRDVVKLVTAPEEQTNYHKQIADSLAGAYQTELFPDGVQLLDALVREGGPVASYAAYRKIMAENALKVEQPGANQMALQKEFLANLETFLNKYPQSDEAPEALFQLASFNEFNAEEEQARKYYSRLAAQFAQTDPGKKAAGALRRLDLVGKSVELKGAGLSGEAVDSSSVARGKLLLLEFWATWADPAKRDLPELVKTYQKYHSKGLEIIGVDLDNDKASLEAFLKDNPLPWSQIFEPGGMDSRLANEFGIISLPTMLLVDGQGKVVTRSIRTAAELEKQLEKLGVERAPATARQ